MKKIFSLTLLLAGLLSQFSTHGQSVAETPYYPMQNWDTSPYKSYRFTRADKEWINFRLLFPNGYDSTAQNGQEYPLIIVLHGGGESARMEWNNSTKTNTPYPEGDPRIDNNDHHLLYGGKEHLKAVQENRFPGFVLFPQNFYGIWVNGNGGAETSMYKDLEKALGLLEYLIEELKIDPNRIYIHGLSKGAVGTWYATYRRPDLFAAALPMSAHGDPAMAERLSAVPLWVFQGKLDHNPSPEKTSTTVNAIRNAGGSVRYTEYENRGHNTWNSAYQEPDFFEWMLGITKDGTPPANMAPFVDAGEDKTLQLPASSVSFTATASDPDGSVALFSWKQTEGPGPQATLSETNSSMLEITNLQKGSYIFQVTVTDNDGLTASDQVKLTVTEGSGKGDNGENENDQQDGEDQRPLSIKEDESDDTFTDISLKAYPNPFTSFVSLEITAFRAQSFQIHLVSPAGAILHSGRIDTHSPGNHIYTINFPETDPWGAQHYYIQVWSKGGKFKKSFLILKE